MTGGCIALYSRLNLHHTQMALLNSLYGDPAGGFGTRTVTLGSSAVTLKPSPMPKAKKSSKRSSARCTACGEACC